MISVHNNLTSLFPDGFNGTQYLKCLAGAIIGFLIITIIGRLIFGKKSTLNRSVSCAIAVLCIYVVNISLYSIGASFLLSPLPFVTLSGERLVLFNFFSNGFVAICNQILDMLILAFATVLLDNFLPRGKKPLTWLCFRILSVVLTIIVHYLLRLLLDIIIPDGILTFAPVVLIIVLLVSIALSILKLIIGGALTFISPVLGLFYAFFFNNLIGKQLRKATLTTAILCGLVLLLNYLGIGSIAIGTAALIAYLPVLLIGIVLWYLITHLL